MAPSQSDEVAVGPAKYGFPTKEVHAYLIAAAEKLAEDEKKSLQRERSGKLIKKKEDFAAFHKSFLEKLGQQLRHEAASTTDTSLGEHAIPEEVATKVTEFMQGPGNELPGIMPARVMALPREVVEWVWKTEISKRRKDWHKQGEALVAEKAQKVAKETQRAAGLGGRGTPWIEVSHFLTAWNLRFPRCPSFLGLEDEGKGNLVHDKVAELFAAFEAEGYEVSTFNRNGNVVSPSERYQKRIAHMSLVW
mmetsp:Transcript_2056/g.4798  ORF Transcript_2056/g.4798 Transcript_2056/m.4798 type:complete len:249 (-) Transcript_2056:193-939(-)|eukprot:CAMPEP_0178987778 /NCGR_PEP_ID=MMETSP0795-20121207/3457_1 /TAXON_ID=88552 /ORGANISM="Amoebophrya sp., Strain Ameob2" /LENGTH=248 /DNA_ID=CAMNT_0020679005 /DNA_START=312 /DNA_END=1058 /DNA_ORIENTATION=+